MFQSSNLMIESLLIIVLFILKYRLHHDFIFKKNLK